ncbi:MAG: preprotein translocase subunit SecE [Acutalibacteraceae bacterium]|nr:preprotein translocase subunit SecE [Acutalibacteraceae bacterium]
MAKNKKKATSPEKAAAKAAEKEVPAYAAKKKETPKKEKKTEKESKPGFWTNFKDFWKGLFKELKKINWSSAKDTFKNFLVVLLVILVIGIGVWVFDALFVKIRELIYNYSPADAEAAVILLKAQIGLL